MLYFGLNLLFFILKNLPKNTATFRYIDVEMYGLKNAPVLIDLYISAGIA